MFDFLKRFFKARPNLKTCPKCKGLGLYVDINCGYVWQKVCENCNGIGAVKEMKEKS